MNTRQLKQRGRSSANYATSSTQTILANRQTVTGCGCSKRTLETLLRWCGVEIANTAHYPARKRRYMGSQERELATIKSHRAIEEMCFPMIFADMGKEKTMQMNRIEHDLWVRAVNELCRACPFTACPGQTKCVRLAERVVEMKEELQ